MSLNHEFIIVDDETNWKELSSEFYINKNNFEYVAISDNYIQYFTDFFRFFTLYNPTRNENVQGLCYYGITKIPFDSLESVLKMLEHILGIFELAPDEIKLTRNCNKESFESLKISKNKFCKKTNDIISLFSKAKNTKKSIMHFGI